MIFPHHHDLFPPAWSFPSSTHLLPGCPLILSFNSIGGSEWFQNGMRYNSFTAARFWVTLVVTLWPWWVHDLTTRLKSVWCITPARQSSLFSLAPFFNVQLAKNHLTIQSTKLLRGLKDWKRLVYKPNKSPKKMGLVRDAWGRVRGSFLCNFKRFSKNFEKSKIRKLEIDRNTFKIC